MGWGSISEVGVLVRGVVIRRSEYIGWFWGCLPLCIRGGTSSGFVSRVVLGSRGDPKGVGGLGVGSTPVWGCMMALDQVRLVTSSLSG